MLGADRSAAGLAALAPALPHVLQVAAATPSAGLSRVVLQCGAGTSAAASGCAPDGNYGTGDVAFSVVLYDDAGRPLLSGGFEVDVTVTPNVISGLTVTDSYNGSYAVAFQALQAGSFSAAVMLQGELVGGAAQAIVVSVGGMAAPFTAIQPGSLAASAQAASSVSFTVVAADATGLLPSGSADSARITAAFVPSSPGAAPAAVAPGSLQGTYVVTLTAPSAAGAYQLAVRVDGQQINHGRPASVAVTALSPSTGPQARPPPPCAVCLRCVHSFRPALYFAPRL